MKRPPPDQAISGAPPAPLQEAVAEEPAAAICFGWDRATDERSFQAFVRRFGRPELLALLTPRLTDAELTGLIDHLSGLLKGHLAEQEYHRLFLADRKVKRV